MSSHKSGSVDPQAEVSQLEEMQRLISAKDETIEGLVRDKLALMAELQVCQIRLLAHTRRHQNP